MVTEVRPTPAVTAPDGSAASDTAARGRWGFSHVPALDGLRGAAVVAVLLFHAGHLTGGYLGVDLFFVLSGYLITSLLLSEHGATGGIGLKAFWSRRARRLLPALLVLLGGVALYAWFIARPVDLSGIRADGFATLAYVANWRTILHGSSYWDLSLAPSPLQHVWSLAIEEQFYLVWPFVVVVLTRRRTDAARVVWRIATVGAGLSAVLFVGLHVLGASDTRVYEGTDTRAAALLVGAALAAWRFRPDRKSPAPASASGGLSSTAWMVEGAGLAAVVVLGVLWFRLDGQSPWLYRGGLPLASLLAVGVVAVASRPVSPLVGWVFSAPPLRALGKISYGLYLWHWPIYQALDARNGRLPFLGDRFLHDPVLLALKLGLSLAAALLSYRFIESPIRHGAIRRPWGAFSAIGGIEIAAVLVFVSTMGAVAAPGPGNIDGVAKVKVPGAPEIVFAGDSVALSVVGRVAADPVRYGVNPVNRARVGCSVAFAGQQVKDFSGKVSKAPAACADFALRDLATIKPAAVYLLTGSRPNDYIKIGGEYVRACDPGFDANYRRSLTSLVERLHATGAPVGLGTVSHSSKNAFGVEGSEERIDCVDAVIGAVAKSVPDTFVVDTNELLCPDGQPCIEDLGGGPVRSDGLHFDAGPGGDKVAEWIVDQILRDAKLSAAPGTPAHGG